MEGSVNERITNNEVLKAMAEFGGVFARLKISLLRAFRVVIASIRGRSRAAGNQSAPGSGRRRK